MREKERADEKEQKRRERVRETERERKDWADLTEVNATGLRRQVCELSSQDHQNVHQGIFMK